MKLVALFLAVIVTALALSCDSEQPVAPITTLSLKKAAPSTDNTCQDVVRDHDKGKKDAHVVLLCAIQAQGPLPLTQGQKGWVDGSHYYLANQSNKTLDIFDADALTFTGRVSGFAGNLPAGGGTALTNGPGPSAIAFSDHKTAWVSDGNSVTWIVDVEHLSIIGSVNTSIAACDGGTATTHYCGRANEIAYDAEHQLIFVQNPSPLAVAAPHGAIDTYATFINARPPYNIVGTIAFPNRRGQEAPVYDKQTHRMLTAVSGRQVVATVGGVPTVTELYHQYVAVIDPSVVPFTVEKQYDIDCTALGITVAVTPANPTGRTFGINDPPNAIPPDQHMVIPGCGRPIIMNAATGAFINTGITQVGGGNETWYNKGDKNFYTTVGGFVGVIDARAATWTENVDAVGGANPAAWSVKNRIFVIVQASATATACSAFGYQATGCIAIYGHEGKADKNDHDGDDDDD
jgi:hypothetical protein